MCYISNLVKPNFVITYDICSPDSSLIAQKADAAAADKNTKVPHVSDPTSISCFSAELLVFRLDFSCVFAERLHSTLTSFINLINLAFLVLDY